MAGSAKSEELLNNTLLFIVKLFNENNIKNWFIAYGTLLGIVRNDSCIDRDDDIDIIMDISNYNLLKELLLKNNFELESTRYRITDSSPIIKTKDRKDLSTIDFYMAKVDENGNFNDMWENVVWSECYNEKKELVEYSWKDNVLYLPFNYEKKLARRYGNNWRKPQKYPGNRGCRVL